MDKVGNSCAGTGSCLAVFGMLSLVYQGVAPPPPSSQGRRHRPPLLNHSVPSPASVSSLPVSIKEQRAQNSQRSFRSVLQALYISAFPKLGRRSIPDTRQASPEDTLEAQDGGDGPDIARHH